MQKTPPKLSSKPSSGSKRLFFFGFGLLLLTLIIGGAFYLNQFVTVKTVIVNNGQKQATLQGRSIFNDSNILFLNEKESAQEIYNNNSYLKSVVVKKQFPSTIYITATFFQPVTVLEGSEGYFVLSNTGRILKKTKIRDKTLPIIHYYQKLSFTGYSAGDDIEFKDIQESLAFLQAAKDGGLAVNSIDINSPNMIGLNTNTQKVLFSIDKSEKDQLYQLSTVLREFKIQGKQFTKLDLRFDRVIVGE